MKQSVEQFERQRRAERLVAARKGAGYTGPKKATDQFGWNLNNYKAHEQGRNGFGQADAEKYAQAFKVALN